MKFISRKNLNNEPDDFRAYRETTPGARYNGGNFSVPVLKERLLNEQGWICAYCMTRISSVEKAHVEHYCPQEACPERDLDYMNLFAVCNGLTDSYPEKEFFHHCDKTQGEAGKMNGKVKLQKLDPAHPSCESLVTYSLSGSVLSADNNEQVEHELNKALNLNNQALVQRRRSAMDRAMELMKKEQPVGQWRKAFLEKHRQEWLALYKRKDKQAFRPYCMAGVWLINKLLTKPQYQ